MELDPRIAANILALLQSDVQRAMILAEAVRALEAITKPPPATEPTEASAK